MANQPLPAAGAPALADESGLSMVELLVIMFTGLLVIAAAMSVLMVTVRGEAEGRDRATAVQQARVMAEAVTREVREGYGVEVAEPDRLVLLTYVNRTTCDGPSGTGSIACRVSYQCDPDSCTRAEGTPTGALGSPVEVVRGLATGDVFSYRPDATAPNYVGLTLELPAVAGEDAITLDGGVALRNTLLEG